MDDRHSVDVCRVCRSEGTPDKPLFHPCICTGSIKFIHQDCLVQWLNYSKKEYCELCKHKYVFAPIYAADMPKRLPLKDIFVGLVRSVLKAIRNWLHYTLVAVSWLGLVPLTASRMYRYIFNGILYSIMNFQLDFLSTENLISDCFQGCFIMSCTLCAFVSLIWLREQIVHGGQGLDWWRELAEADEEEEEPAPAAENAPPEPAEAANPPEAPAAEVENGGPVHNEDDPNNPDGNNWNPMEWERAVDELTWERLLGLDGSLQFLEHVFWVVSLNALFVLLFAFFPYHIGSSLLSLFQCKKLVEASQFDGILSALAGYLVVCSVFYLLYFTTSHFSFFRVGKKAFGLCYLIVKVFLLVCMELGLFPLACGWWLDICSLSMFDATFKERKMSFEINPFTCMFIHWLVGMVYIFYFASFVLLLREILRPGVLWFLRNLNDPEFNPVQEMIHLPVYKHLRRFMASLVVFGSIVIIMLKLPILFIHRVFPDFLPFHVSGSETLVNELSLELLLLHIILPGLLEQGHTRQWLKNAVRGWCVAVATLLNIRSYLLGDDAATEDVPRPEEPGVEVNEEGVEGDNQGGAENDRVLSSIVEIMDDGVEREHQGDTQPSGDPRNDVVEGVQTSENKACNIIDKSSTPDEHNKETNLKSIDNVDTNSSFIQEFSNKVSESQPSTSQYKARIEKDKQNSAEGSQKSTQTTEMQESQQASTSTQQEQPQQDQPQKEQPQQDQPQQEQPQQEQPQQDQPQQQQEQDQQPQPPPQQRLLLGELHQAMMNSRNVPTTKPYAKPKHFALKIIIFILISCVSLFVTSLVSFLLPVQIGRSMMAFLSDSSSFKNFDSKIINQTKPSEEPLNKSLHTADVNYTQAFTIIDKITTPNNNTFHNLFLFKSNIINRKKFFKKIHFKNAAKHSSNKTKNSKRFSIRNNNVHELYTAASGLYVCWLFIRLAILLATWLPRGLRAIASKCFEWVVLFFKASLVALLIIGLIPLLMGVLFQLFVLIPIRVPSNQTPVFFPWQDWMLGLLLLKIITAITLMGPDWRLRNLIEQAYNQGLRHMDVRMVVFNLCMPVLVFLGLCLSVPYAFVHSILPLWGADIEFQYSVKKQIYPMLLMLILGSAFGIFQARQFIKLYEHIKNDKYLIGLKLVNYEKKS